MQKQLDALLTFNKSFEIEYSESPTLISVGDARLRFDLMEEENIEYFDAVKENNLVEIADALGDQLYILCGTILSHGMQHIIEKVFDEIQDSNMSKLDDNGKPIINGKNGVYDSTRPLGKVLKPKNFRSPNLEQFL